MGLWNEGFRRIQVFVLMAATVLPLQLLAQQAQNEFKAQSLTADQIVERMTERNRERSERLQHVTSIRHYHLEYHGFPGDRAASMEVEAQFDAPGSKSFRVLSQTGSKLLIDRVLKKLLESESDATKHQHNSDLTVANYKFELKGTEKNANASYYVLAVEPRAASKYLYRGQVWVDANDFAVARIDAQPAVNPSFMIRKTEIHHVYAKVGHFWFPQQNRTVSKIRMGGVATLAIDYGEYKLGDTPDASRTAESDAALGAGK